MRAGQNVALALGALLLVAGVGAGAGDVLADVQLSVVEQSPQLAMQLGAAVAAALGGAGGEGGEGGVRVARVEPSEPLALAAHVCAEGARGAAAATGGAGRGGEGARLAASAAARAGTPLLLVEPSLLDAAWETLAMYPHPDVFTQVCAVLCREKGWERAVVLHEGGAGQAARLAPVVVPMAVSARQLPPPGDGVLLRNLLLVLKKSGKTNFIVWCEAACARRVLDAAQRVGLLAERHAYIVLALDLHTLDLDEFSHGGANVTGVRLFDPESDAVRVTMAAWRDAYLSQFGERASEAQVEEAERVQAAPPTSLLLAHHAARLVAVALQRLELPNMRPSDCKAGRGAFHADTLLNYLRSEEWKEEEAGGPISWDADGGRRALQFEVVELQRGGRLQHAGMWAAHAGLVWQRDDLPAPEPPPDSMTNRTFNVLIALNDPYVMRRQSTERLTGNKRYEGFCIELIEKLAEILHFNYTFVEEPNSQYGTFHNDTGKWDGMLGRIMEEDDMHFAITDLTITEERERAVDFTTPFMNLGISILFRKPKPPEPELFAFLLPFSNDVWLCLGFAYLGTSLLLYVVGRLSHEEWQNPYPCIEDPPALENQFTLANALWFNLGAVLLQGSEIAPVAYSTRAVASVWWLFALVITSSYTANLATLLAKKTTNELIHNVDELAHNQIGINYGAKKGGSTYTFFEQSKTPLYKEMFAHMRQHKPPKNNREGINWVANNETYAFLMESTTIEYEIERNCEVTKVGGLLDSKGYGIAMRKGSQYRQSLNLALLKLQEAGVLREMKNSWWIEKNGGGACKAGEERGSAGLAMPNFRGLFLVLTVGCALGVVLSVLDLAVSTARRARACREPFSRRFLAELRFVFRFESSVKPIHGPLSSPSSDSEGERESLAAEEAAGAEAEVEAGDGEGEREGSARLRSGSRASNRRRRSSMHAASVRLARHLERDSDTPASRR